MPTAPKRRLSRQPHRRKRRRPHAERAISNPAPLAMIEYVAHPMFDQPDASARLEQMRPGREPGSDTEAIVERQNDERPTVGADPAGKLAGLHAPLLSKPWERYFFVRMNFLKFRARAMQRRLPARPANAILPERIEALLTDAASIRNAIVEANLRLVVSIASQWSNKGARLDELVSDCMPPLIRAVELFDVSRGGCFSTYATQVIRNAIRRSLQMRSREIRRVMDLAAQSGDTPTVAVPANASEETSAASAALRRSLQALSEREQLILAARYGMNEFERPHTFQEIGAMVGLSKERVRVIANQSLDALRAILPCSIGI